MSSGQKNALQSLGVGETFQPPADLLRITEEDPAHPHHAEHMARVRADDPDMLALVASFREFGWRKAVTLAVYLDGDAYAVSDGRRRLTAVRIENARRKAERDKRGPIRPRVVVDDNPALTTTLANAMRKDDPPMVKARRFVENSETMGAQAAARAAGFLTIADANACAAILRVPDAALHAAVNRGEVTVDSAARAAKKGTKAVREVLTRSRLPSGKIDSAKADAAVKEVVPPRPRMRNADEIGEVAAALVEAGETKAAHALLWALRKNDAAKWLEKAVESAEAARKTKGGAL